MLSFLKALGFILVGIALAIGGISLLPEGRYIIIGGERISKWTPNEPAIQLKHASLCACNDCLDKDEADLEKDYQRINRLQKAVDEYGRAFPREFAEEVLTLETEKTVLVGTMYNAVKGQTDDSPLTTADNSKIDLQKLYDHELRWVALSRNLLDRWGGPFNYGDRIMVEGAPVLRNGFDVNGVWEVHDSMNQKYEDYIDFLMPAHVKRDGKWVHSMDLAGSYYFKQDGVFIRLVK